MSAFVFYRLPYAERAWMLKGNAVQLQSCHELNERQGFVFAPFNITPEQPILLIEPFEMSALPLFLFKQSNETMMRFFEGKDCRQTVPDADYATDFASFHDQLQKGVFQKLVLSRSVVEEPEYWHDYLDLFRMACSYYPRMFVSVVLTEEGGLWLTATPELLLEGDGNRWRTTALAGTMKLDGEQLKGEGEHLEWSDKNQREQRLVASYISECLSRFTSDIQEEGPRSVRAANLVHLRSDFTFSLPDGNHLGDLLHELHPTPAVCGLPKREAFDFILRHERTSRSYYSGFQGLLNVDTATHLYVNLRCMEIYEKNYRLYAGGGLLSDSTVEQEWMETEAKLQTMRLLLVHSS